MTRKSLVTIACHKTAVFTYGKETCYTSHLTPSEMLALLDIGAYLRNDSNHFDYLKSQKKKGLCRVNCEYFYVRKGSELEKKLGPNVPHWAELYHPSDKKTPEENKILEEWKEKVISRSRSNEERMKKRNESFFKRTGRYLYPKEQDSGNERTEIS